MSSAERVWLITGCSAGFGRRLVYSALARGDKVIATARSLSKIEDLSENPFVEDKADNLRLLALDVTAGFAVIKEILDKANKIWGRIDVLVNNAGYGVPATIEEGGVESIKLQFATNLYGPIDVINAALPHMRALKSGTIVNVGSRSAWKTELPGIGPYSASKAALHALTETLTFELAQFNIKVLLVAPGAFKTEGAYNYPWDNPNPLPAYDIIRTASLEKLGSIRDAIKGDPQKAMEVVVDVVRGEGVAKGREWPTYLILGEDAEVDIRNKIGKIAKALDDWQDVIRSVNL
ncbi:NAD(P)-binding protein [Pleurotus eryngii]|uniref:NAD(P)-binding protein n=1 Tax=Pleurotus eryngii TaxID=5323 RepID=A0A9P5ZUU1_PLEER|nr:NAD(P)-binding protein [Pleurotus eryngii]